EHFVHATLNAAALEEVVIHVHMVHLCADRLALLGVPDHDVGIGTDCNRPLAGVKTKNLGGVGGHQLDKSGGIEVPFVDAIMPHDLHAVFDHGQAVRNLGKVAFA